MTFAFLKDLIIKNKIIEKKKTVRINKNLTSKLFDELLRHGNMLDLGQLAQILLKRVNLIAEIGIVKVRVTTNSCRVYLLQHNNKFN